MSFGFSVGDFLSAVELVRDLIDALNSTKGSSAHFTSLVRELYSLERALLEVKGLQLPPHAAPQLCAVQQVASQCQSSIQSFILKNDVYFQTLREGGSVQGWKDVFRKITWRLYKKDDVEELRATLNGHTSSINILIGVLQLQSIKASQARLEPLPESLGQRFDAQATLLKIQADMLQNISEMASRAVSDQQKRDQTLHMLMMKSISMNLQIYETILQLQSQLPAQVLREQPVYLEDAKGAAAPFYLEFVTSLDILVYALKDRFSVSGARKVEQKRFAITDARTNRDVNLLQEWKRCFRPGQRANMALFFNDDTAQSLTCPGCGTEQLGDAGQEITCSCCEMTYRRIEELDESATRSTYRQLNARRQRRRVDDVGRFSASPSQGKEEDQEASVEYEETDEIDDEDPSEYKRIRLFAKVSVRWNHLDSSPYMRVSGEGLDVWYGGPMRYPGDYQGSIIRATKPFSVSVHGDSRDGPGSNLFVYFEVTIVRSGDLEIIGVGMCTDWVPLEKLPGWEDGSYGYHGDNGGGYLSYPFARLLGPTFTKGDVIGCGITSDGLRGYFTKNGVLLGGFPLMAEDSGENMYPAVGLKERGARVRANFGRSPFVFDLRSVSSALKGDSLFRPVEVL